MKTITPKNAFKLFLFLLILFSAKVFSYPKLPKDGDSNDCSSKIGFVTKSKPIKISGTPSSKSCASSKGGAMQFNNTGNITPRVTLKVGIGK